MRLPYGATRRRTDTAYGATVVRGYGPRRLWHVTATSTETSPAELSAYARATRCPDMLLRAQSALPGTDIAALAVSSTDICTSVAVSGTNFCTAAEFAEFLNAVSDRGLSETEAK
eukprot:2971673-Rhodomonas_salina.2